MARELKGEKLEKELERLEEMRAYGSMIPAPLSAALMRQEEALWQGRWQQVRLSCQRTAGSSI